MMKMNPMMMSVVALVVVLLLAIIILYFVKPSIVLKDANSTQKDIAWDKLVAYSGLVAILAAIVVLLVYQGKENYKPSMYSPKFKMCGTMH
jgi:O-antigen/teichoic acid export membrane protein